MTNSKVDDVWAQLKAKSSPSAQCKKALPDIQPVCIPQNDRANVADGPLQEVTVSCNSGHSTDVAPRQLCGPDTGAFLAPIQRDINCLTDSDRSTRKRAITKLHDYIVDAQVAPDVLQEAMQGALHRNVVAMLGDVTETCRGTALSILAHTVRTVPDCSAFLPAMMIALKLRMGVGEPTAVEESEEIRFRITEIAAHQLATLPNEGALPLKDDLVALLIRCLDDPFHETRKCAFAGISSLAGSLPQGSLKATLPKLLDPVSACIHHTHSRVRAAAVDALNHLLQHTPISPDLLSSKVVPNLRTLALDRTASIREATFVAVATWLGAPGPDGRTCPTCNPSEHAGHLLPALLLGITDPNEDVGRRALASTESVGEYYCAHVLSGDDDSDTAPDTSEMVSAAAASWPPPFNGRPALPARRMVQHQLSTVLPPVMKEMREWTVALRLPASRSLFSTAVLAEAALQPHLPVLLPALCSAVGDQDETVALRVISTAQVVGAFCEVCPLSDLPLTALNRACRARAHDLSHHDFVCSATAIRTCIIVGQVSTCEELLTVSAARPLDAIDDRPHQRSYRLPKPLDRLARGADIDHPRCE